MTAARPDDAFAAIPDPGRARTLDGLIEGLRSLKVWAGDPSYEWITSEINAAWTAAGRPAGELTKRPTVGDCFKPGRRRLNTDLVIAIVRALHPDVGYVAQWRQALRVVGGETLAAAQVRVQDRLPPDLVGFTGRSTELDHLRQALHHGTADGGAVVISAIAGMAGVGKTQLAIHAGHLLTAEEPFDRVLFVNLRGFHPDPAQPPADPAAVLDGFLRLLGVPGQQIPHDLDARAAVYRGLLAGIWALVVLDNAADADQVRPLLPDTPGCLTLVTSRRSLTDLHSATHLAVDVFTADEARQFLTRVAPHVPVGDDPDAAARIAQRCGYLPLALGLVAGHMRAKPGWTLTDHAEWLDERHHQRRLDSGVELALDLSYQHLPADERRLLRLAASHPGQDFDAYAAAALADTDLDTTQTRLDHLDRDHLLQQGTPGRYTFHDLVRAYATSRASDEDPPPQRRAALTRLFDYYLAAAAATAMDSLHPGEACRRPRIPAPGAPSADLTDPDTARAWLETERPILVAVAAHTATNGWPTHTVRLSATLFRYLDGGHHTDALTVHGHARHAAQHTGDLIGQAHALTNVGVAHMQLGRHGPATDCHRQALTLFRQADDPTGEAYALTSLGNIEARLGRYPSASDHHEQALSLFRQPGDRVGQAYALSSIGIVEVRLGRHGSGADRLKQALTLYRQAGNRDGEAWTLDSLGTLHTRLGQPAQAAGCHQQALTVFRETGERDGEAWALNGLGEAARTAGHPTDALTHHTAAHAVAVEIGARDQQACAHAGLGHAHHSLRNLARARHHYQQALTLYTDLGVPEAGQIRARLTTLDDNPNGGDASPATCLQGRSLL
jgi:tetratricopeptide (TPR) repeat protein